VVFGKIVGDEAAKLIKGIREKRKTGEPLLLRLDVNSKKEFEDGIFVAKEPFRFRDEIQELMKLNVGIIREESKLKNGLKGILELKKEFYSKDSILKEYTMDDDDAENVVLTWQVKSSLVVCEAIIRSALMRQESRGAHYRSDFPKLDEEKWNVNIYCRKEGTEMVLFKQNVKEIKGPLANLLEAHIKPEHQREFE
jgi:succinate dehydrogenase / fumarate reductase, flavoprotein subunit